MEYLGTLGGPTSFAIRHQRDRRGRRHQLHRRGYLRSVPVDSGGRHAASEHSELASRAPSPNAINTHHRVVGEMNTFFCPVLFDSRARLRVCPLLAAVKVYPIPERVRPDRGHECDCGGAIRAVLWTPTRGRLPSRLPAKACNLRYDVWARFYEIRRAVAGDVYVHDLSPGWCTCALCLRLSWWSVYELYPVYLNVHRL